MQKSNSLILLQGGRNDDDHRFINEEWLKGHLNSVIKQREPKSVLELISPTTQHNNLVRRRTEA